MNKLDDKTRIQLLKAALIGSGLVTMIVSASGQIVLKEYEKLKEKHRFENRILRRYAELAGDEVNKQIYDEFAFEWITKDVIPPPFPKEK
jgi:hypothetical protein